MAEALLCRLGRTAYRPTYALQTRLVEQKRRLGTAQPPVFLITEHEAVYTLGRRGGREHLVVSEQFLAEQGITIEAIERGGDITYHGPGQLVVYPILHLREEGLSVLAYVEALEEVMLRTAGDFGVGASRDPRNHGVWVGQRKLGSIGIAIRHGISFHGLALNVNLALTPFSWINPCGLVGVQMTSLAEAGGQAPNLAAVTDALIGHLADIFPFTFTELQMDHLLMAEVC